MKLAVLARVLSSGCSRCVLPRIPVVCGSCRAIAPFSSVENQPLEQLLGVPEGVFALDRRGLDLNFRALQRVLHPDANAGLAEQAKRDREMVSALVNDAYNTLKREDERAVYFLRRLGVDLNEATCGADPALLHEMFELREELDSGGCDPERLEALRADTQAAIDAAVGAMDAHLRAAEIDQAKRQGIKILYLCKLRSELVKVSEVRKE
jgi:Fe-S protein assembly co-chaperone HscB